MPPLPSFFVIGPPRTGSTWLHHVLGRRALLPSPTKETRFFDSHFHRGLDWYRAHYRQVPNGRCIGEIAPTYFASSSARERIARTVPNARVICTFRNPVDRVFSLYRVKRAYGLIHSNFEQAILSDPELLESGKYATHLKAWQQALGREQVLPTIYDDLLGQPQCYLDRLADFINLPRLALAPSELRRVHGSDTLTKPRLYPATWLARSMADWLKAQRLDTVVAAVRNSPLFRLLVGNGPAFEELSSETSRWIYQHFRPEIEELEILLDRDLTAWKFLGEQAEPLPLAV
ncbi:MAG TPA: sulfotransferase [Terriglobales bacterium]